MRWMWIDRIVELVPSQRAVAIKNVTMAEEHLHDHFASQSLPDGRVRDASPVMPASLIIEGMAQTAGILVGHAVGFKEKVILAKVSSVDLAADVGPGMTLRYTATVQQIDRVGAATVGVVEVRDNAVEAVAFAPIGRVDLMFSYLDQNMAGLAFPSHNFVFSESFRTLLRLSGIDAAF